MFLFFVVVVAKNLAHSLIRSSHSFILVCSLETFEIWLDWALEPLAEWSSIISIPYSHRHWTIISKPNCHPLPTQLTHLPCLALPTLFSFFHSFCCMRVFMRTSHSIEFNIIICFVLLHIISHLAGLVFCGVVWWYRTTQLTSKKRWNHERRNLSTAPAAKKYAHSDRSDGFNRMSIGCYRNINNESVCARSCVCVSIKSPEIHTNTRTNRSKYMYTDEHTNALPPMWKVGLA